jgi:AcrR family transcriptional regulator
MTNRKSGLRRPKEPEASREDFLGAAYELFCKKGYHETSLDDVILLAKRSKGGFYHHFKSKSELFLQMFEMLMEEAYKAMERGFQNDLSNEEVIKEYLETAKVKKMIFTAQSVKAVVELYLLAVRDREVLKIIRRFNALGIDLCKKFLKRSVQRGEIAPLGRYLNERAELLYHSSRGIFIMEVILNDGKNLLPKLVRFMEWEKEKMKVK